MDKSDTKILCETRFAECFGRAPELTASAPGRIEVLGNHTDYNLGLTLSCAVGQRCCACIAVSEEPAIRLSSTSEGAEPVTVSLDDLSAPDGHWARYVLGLVTALQDRGQEVPGFAMLIHSDVPRSAGLSSSSALEMSALMAMTSTLKLDLSPMQLAKIGQHVESVIVGAQTGLLDQLTALLGDRDRLLGIDFQSLETHHHTMPEGWCFVAVDSGVKHDLTHEYNQRRVACEQAAAVMGVSSLREATTELLAEHLTTMDEGMWRCARHVIDENQRVVQACEALARGDVETLGQLMFASHASSRDYFRNSCDELDALVQFAQDDPRCVGARLSGGGFGGVTVHLLREEDADTYLSELQNTFVNQESQTPWGCVCRLDHGARIER